MLNINFGEANMLLNAIGDLTKFAYRVMKLS